MYIALHSRGVLRERKQKVQEKDQLKHERSKMHTRVGHLKQLSEGAWERLVISVFARKAPDAEQEERWAKGRKAVIRKGAEWLRGYLVKEGQELLDRYDQLLPPEPRK